VGIDSVYLEEDSARQNGTRDGREIYRLDRLGIPLVEIATKPDLKNAKHVKEAALKIGDILRSCKVRRGIGTIRQDLNISIQGSNRVEIKGFQEPKIMEKCVELEVLRQKVFLDKNSKNPAEVRGCLEDGSTEFLRPMPGADRMYPETDLELLKISKELIDEIKENLPQLKSEVEEYLRRHGLEEELIKVLFKSNKFDDFKELFEAYGNARLVGRLLLVYPKDLAAKSKKSLEEIETIINIELIGFVLDKVNKSQLHEQDIKHVLELVLEGKNIKEAVIFEKKETGELEEKIMNLIKEKPGLSVNAYMGLIMKEFKGQISGEEATGIIKRFVK
jgi:Glu-tRNA(Gln) amidotransferase subunit E-like FAD-binding protein